MNPNFNLFMGSVGFIFIDDSPMESFHSILKKETLYNNNITSLEEYIVIVEDWIEFYNTARIKLGR